MLDWALIVDSDYFVVGCFWLKLNLFEVDARLVFDNSCSFLREALVIDHKV